MSTTHLSPAPLLHAVVQLLLSMPMRQVRTTVEALENAIVQFEHCEVTAHVLPTCVSHLRELPALIGEALALEIEAVLDAQPDLRSKVEASKADALAEMAKVAADAEAARVAEAAREAAASAPPEAEYLQAPAPAPTHAPDLLENDTEAPAPAAPETAPSA